MLPILILQPGELLKFDNSLTNMQLLPQDAVLPEAEFGDLLELRLGEPAVIEFQPGETLPESGSVLPQASPQQPLRQALMLHAEALAEQLQPSDISQSAEPLDMPLSDTETPVPPVEMAESVVAMAHPGADAGGVPAANAAIGLAQSDNEDVPAAATAPRFEFARGTEPSEVESLIASPAATARVAPATDRRVQASAPEAGLRPDPAIVSDVARSTSAPPASPATAPTDGGDAPVAVAQPQTPARIVVEAPMPRQPGTVANPDTGVPSIPKNPAPEIVPAATVAADKSQPRAAEPGADEFAVLARSAASATPPASRPVLAQAAAAPLQAAAQSFAVETPVQDTAWGERVGERVLLMASNQLKTAEIRLSPAELGPLRVQLSVDDGAASIAFHAQHAVARDAIEQALPRLREMLVENGLSLGQATVGDQGVAQQDGTGGDGEGGRAAAVAHADEQAAASASEVEPTLRHLAATDSLVDTYV